MMVGFLICIPIVLVLTTKIRAVTYVEVERPSPRNYSLSTDICCNGTIYENKNSLEHECCAGKLLHKETEICCFPETYPRHANTECCQNLVFDNSIQQCTRENSHVTRYSTRTRGKFVVLPLPIPNHQYCGDKLVNLIEEICCNYQIIPDPEQKFRCCGNDGGSYDPDTHVCCDKEVGSPIVAKSTSTDDNCCNGVSYDSKRNDCSKDVLIPKLSDEFNICQNEVFNGTTEVCCWGFLNPKVIPKADPKHSACCGYESYSHWDDQSLCCKSFFEGKLHPATSEFGGKLKCCGLETMAEDQSCCGYETPYDPKTQTCCYAMNYIEKKKIINIFDEADGKCCGTELMDAEQEECCGTTIIPKSPDGQSGCCSHGINDLSYEPIITMKDYRYFTTD